jgi:hypothetical protein
MDIAEKQDIHMAEAVANDRQGTPSGNDLDAKLAADEAGRVQIAEPELENKLDEPEIEEVETEPDAKAAEDETAKTPEKAENESESDLNKRNARLFHEKREAQRQTKMLQAQLARLQGTAPPDADADTASRIEQRAVELASQKAYNDTANAIYTAGTKDFPDFESALAGFRDLGGVSPQLVEAAHEAGDAHKIIYYLAKNLDEAERIIGLKPHQMGVALSKIGVKLSAPPPPPKQSNAPAPIKPVAGRGGQRQDMMAMSMADYQKSEDAKYGR